MATESDKLALLKLMNNEFIYNDEGVPQDCPQTLEKIYSSINDNTVLFRYLIEILIGVGYLHKNHMGHGNLSMNTIYMKNPHIIIAGFDLNDGLKPTEAMKNDIKGLRDIVQKLSAQVQDRSDKHEPEYKKKMEEIEGKLDPDSMSPIQEVLRMNFLHYMAKKAEPALFKKIFAILGENLEIQDGEGDIKLIKEFLIGKKVMKEADFDANANNTTGEWDYDDFMRGEGDFMEEYYPPHGWGAVGLAKKENNSADFSVDVSPIAFHGLKPGFYKLEEKISGIYQDGFKKGPTQDKKNETNTAKNKKTYPQVGEGIFHNYSMRPIIYNQYVGPESVDLNKGQAAGDEENEAPPKDLFLFAFMCKVKASEIKIPKSDPTCWLIGGDGNPGEKEKFYTKPFKLLFKRANIYRLADPAPKKDDSA